MATLTKTQLLPTQGKQFESVGQTVEKTFRLSAASGNGDTFDVGMLVDHVVFENDVGVTWSVQLNQPQIGRSKITMSAGVTGAKQYVVTVKGRP